MGAARQRHTLVVNRGLDGEASAGEAGAVRHQGQFNASILEPILPARANIDRTATQQR